MQGVCSAPRGMNLTHIQQHQQASKDVSSGEIETGVMIACDVIHSTLLGNV